METSGYCGGRGPSDHLNIPGPVSRAVDRGPPLPVRTHDSLDGPFDHLKAL
ncbi:MAG TPA: hypothetical protein VFW35_07425 [Sphingomicrobium sp.]|nr:hypothetical protein [Sphingomicrobium sp.]